MEEDNESNKQSLRNKQSFKNIQLLNDNMEEEDYESNKQPLRNKDSLHVQLLEDNMEEEEYDSNRQPLRKKGSLNLQLLDHNRKTFIFFRCVGIFPISSENGKFKVHENQCMIYRFCWFLLHLFGVAVMWGIRLIHPDKCSDSKVNQGNVTMMNQGKVTMMNQGNVPMMGMIKSAVGSPCSKDQTHWLTIAFGILMFILVDSVQTKILKRNLDFMPTILNEIAHLEKIKIGNKASRKFHVSNKLLKKNSSLNTSTAGDDHQANDIDSNCCSNSCTRYNVLRYSIFWLSMLGFLGTFGYGCFIAIRHPDQEDRSGVWDEWKFFGSLVYLVFPTFTTWFCVFMIGYQRKMYKVLNELPDDQFYNEEIIKSIGDYCESMQKISGMLIKRFYRFTFGINFALFVIIGTNSLFEILQGLAELQNPTELEFEDIIYLLPISICVFNMFISCEKSSSLVTGQHAKLLCKLKGIITRLLVDEMEKSKENEKKCKRVECLHKNLKDCSPMAEIYGGYKVNYSLFTGILLFIFTYSRVFYGVVEKK
ncbi:unnamed protein product [Meganyctiphanes norvegica]|uniref:Gustatory receptor n=1 Tax=Meganyctiphanes norvegica TaxID=48144 RepID=A0AAV2PYS1_MEGNR